MNSMPNSSPSGVPSESDAVTSLLVALIFVILFIVIAGTIVFVVMYGCFKKLMTILKTESHNSNSIIPMSEVQAVTVYPL